MRQVHGHKSAVAAGALAVLLFAALPANAQEVNQNSGFSLPGVTLPQGTDEVRAADGTSCRSAVGGNGAYLDVGVIGKQSTADDNAYYGRVVVPLGKSPKRLDCAKLYELEVERLKLELELAKAGLGRTQDAEIDSTETAAVDEESVLDEPVEPQVPQAKKKAAVEEAVVEEVAVEQPVEPVKKKPAKKKVGKANWDQEGWTTEGRNGG
jgi:hypothetical protein